MIEIAFSPCPNDTFIFNDLAHQSDITAYLHDVEQLNRLAFTGRYDVTKLSFHAWLLLRETYQLLEVGAALGRGCGPLLITREAEPLPERPRVALPGELTTAHLLYRLCYGNRAEKVFMPFHEIMDALAAGEVDAGVIIHEGRFVFEERGFHCVQDLGVWWEAETGLPIPLGCIAVRRNLGKEVISDIEQRLKRSIELAFAHPEKTQEYVRAHAQELDSGVMEEHIKTYVNTFTRGLGKEGRAAVMELEKRALAAGVIS